MFKQLFVAFIFVFFNLPAQSAVLIGFEDSFMLMSETGKYNQKITFNYAPSVHHAFGIEVTRMSPEGEGATTMTGINYTQLIKRWNMPSAQANLWFTGSLGEANGEHDGFSYSPGVQFDYETTRVYFLARARLMRAPGMNSDTAAVQGGFSFYEADFDATQPWFIVEAKVTRNFDPNIQVTPALRFINKSFFLEIGITNPFDKSERAPQLNLVFTY